MHRPIPHVIEMKKFMNYNLAIIINCPIPLNFSFFKMFKDCS
jgi:hypothetical protein